AAGGAALLAQPETIAPAMAVLRARPIRRLRFAVWYIFIPLENRAGSTDLFLQLRSQRFDFLDLPEEAVECFGHQLLRTAVADRAGKAKLQVPFGIEAQGEGRSRSLVQGRAAFTAGAPLARCRRGFFRRTDRIGQLFLLAPHFRLASDPLGERGIRLVPVVLVILVVEIVRVVIVGEVVRGIYVLIFVLLLIDLFDRVHFVDIVARDQRLGFDFLVLVDVVLVRGLGRCQRQD